MENKQFPEEERIPAEAPEILEIPFAPAADPIPEEVVVSEEDTAEEILVTEDTAVEETVIAGEPLPEEVTVSEEIAAEETAASEEITADETAVSEVIPEEAATVSEAIPEEGTAVSEAIPEEAIPEESLPAPEAPFVEGSVFMSRIPDVEEDCPEETPEEAVSDPVAQAEEPEEEPEEESLDREYRDNGQDFDEMLHAPAPEKKRPEHQRPARKGRPKRKKGEGLLGIPNILVTFVWLALIVTIGVTAGRMLWICAADVLAFGREDRAVTITIYEADTMDDIVDKLHRNGLIRYKSLFNLYASISDAEEDIKPGIYDLNTRYDYHALVNFMSPRSSRTVVENLLIPEGYTCQQIFELLEEKRVCTAVDLASYAANGELKDYWFLEGVQRGSEYCLEGYLFPDTYDFYKNSSPREVLEKLLDNFDYRFSEEMRAQLETLNTNLTGDYTVREITIVASLIEKESASPEESPKVAGVIYNRLFNWGNNPAYLNIDASIVYALGGKSELTREDLQIDDPYNTYTNIGLTPGPIANPGLSSLKAALNPETHNYYYYVLNPSTGMHQFSTTNEEHNAWVAQFYD